MLRRAGGKRRFLNTVMFSDEAIFNTSVKCTVLTYKLGFSTHRRTAGPPFFIQDDRWHHLPGHIPTIRNPTSEGKDCTPSFPNRTALHLILVITLKEIFSDRWLGKSGQIPWPLKLPYLTLLDSSVHRFFLEGPRSRCYGRTAALRLLVQPCDEDENMMISFFHFSK
jgi:hypothetical protein